MGLRYSKGHRRVANNPPIIPPSSNFKPSKHSDDASFLPLIQINFQQKVTSKANDGYYQYVIFTIEYRIIG
jgi:hypothetical protein